jgi:hypothetical protein
VAFPVSVVITTLNTLATRPTDKLDGGLRLQRGRCRCSDLGGFDCADHDEFLGAFPWCDESACLEQAGRARPLV